MPEANENDVTNEPSVPEPTGATPAAADAAPVKKAARKAPAKKAPAKKAAGSKTPAKKTAARKAPAKKQPAEPAGPEASGQGESGQEGESGPAVPGTMLLFQTPDTSHAPPPRKPRKSAAASAGAEESGSGAELPEPAAADDAEPAARREDSGDGEDAGESGRRRRRRGGRRRRKSGDSEAAEGESGSGDGADADQGGSGDRAENAPGAAPDQGQGGTSNKSSTGGASGKRGTSSKSGTSGDKGGKGGKTGDDGAGAEQASGQDGDGKEAAEGGGESTSSRRRRRRRRAGDGGGSGGSGTDDDPQNTVTKVRKGRSPEDQITALTGSTRLEAKKQRRREGREAGRRRPPIVSEAEFLARRESVDRVMAIRQRDDLTQIAVIEDKVLVEHYVARESQTSLIGNVYLGRVQNVLPSMEAAFIDIGKGRNAVLYAGEVNWSALGHQEGQPRKIESVLSSGQTVLVQVTKDPVGHKGARLTSQISLAGRFLVYVPDGTNSGISRKLPDTERNRLKKLLKEVVPEGAGVIVRTAAEGASEEELTHDVQRLTARWTEIEKGMKKTGSAPHLLYGEPDLMLKVVRDLFTEDFSRLAVQGEDAWDTVQGYVSHVAPDLEERLEKFDDPDGDLFASHRIDEQIHKGLDRKVWLPSGGSLIIDRTEAMTVVDVNTGKFTGSGGNLEETVTKNNLEAAEEIVRQLRLRDIGGIIVVDFIDMVLESNRDLVLRRLVECLGRDRTRHQVAEVTSLGLVQMTRKRIGTGLLEAFSQTCEHCGGRGVLVADAPVEPKKSDDDSRRSRRSRGKGKGRGDSGESAAGNQPSQPKSSPSPKDVAAMSKPPTAEDEKPAGDDKPAADEKPAEDPKPAAEAKPAEDPKPAEATAPQGEPEHEPAAESEPTPIPEQSVEQPSEQPAQPEQTAPKVVTRTRRRSASRPAGPPAGVATETSSASPAADPAAPAATADEAPDDPQASAPRAEGVEDQAQPASEASVEHVPVKKRGSRKR